MAMGREEVGFLGETAETHALERNDLACDGVFQRTRAQMAEAEMIRDGYDGHVRSSLGMRFDQEQDTPRQALLRAAENTEPTMKGYAIVPLDDRIKVRYASFREGYVCEACDGTGESETDCDQCHGSKWTTYGTELKRKECTLCRYPGADHMEPFAHGKQRCQECRGSGLKNSSIAIPDASKQDHSFGDIVSVGAQVYDLQIGDRVIFSKMAGVYMKSGESDKYGKDINYCLLRRGEVMGLMVKK